MKIIYQVDSFAEEPFKGNPAGVMMVDESTRPEWMQNMAQEMNVPATAFAIPKEGYYRLKYFTPERELPLCGHATLACAHMMYQTGIAGPGGVINFKAQGGDLTASHEAGGLIKMNFPAFTITKTEPIMGFKEVVGFEPAEIYRDHRGFVVAVAPSRADIVNAAPDFEAMKKNGLGHLIITAEGEDKDVDFVSRCFAPESGLNEDPVTGSAHCALTPLWYQKTGKQEMNALQLSKRTGKLRVKLINDRVEISGKAVTVFKAELKV